MANERLRRELVEGMQALKRVGAIDGITMRKFEKELLGAPPSYSPKKILALRERYEVSQAVFAVFLNVSASTVQKWEQGQKVPSSVANRLLQVIEEYGLGVLVPKPTSKKLAA
jgi:putative transcriptional regulator